MLRPVRTERMVHLHALLQLREARDAVLEADDFAVGDEAVGALLMQ
jgi:hypothetical protein